MLKLYRISERFYEALRERPYGSLVPYSTLSAIAEADARTTAVRGALLRAGRRLLRDDQKLLVCRPTVGYEIAKPEDHLTQSRRFQTQATRRQKRALEITVYVPLEALSAAQQAAILSEQTRVQIKLAVAKYIDKSRDLPAASAATPQRLEAATPELIKRVREAL